MPPPVSLTVVVPAFNEADALDRNLAEVRDYLARDAADFDWRMLVVNDGSRDATGAIAEAFAAKWPGVDVVHHATNRGLGTALRTGFAATASELVVTLDADLSYGPAVIGRLARAWRRTGAALVLASPYHPAGRVRRVPVVRQVLSRGANQVLRRASAGRLHTFTGMVRLYTRELLSELKLDAAGPEIHLQVVHQAMEIGARVAEVPAALEWRVPRPGRLQSGQVLRQVTRVLHWAGRFRRLSSDRRQVTKF